MMYAIHNRKLRIFPHEMLKVDILKINILERLIGYKLAAADDEHGHADRAMSLALGLPMAFIAMSDFGKRNGVIPGMFPAANETLSRLLSFFRRQNIPEDHISV